MARRITSTMVLAVAVAVVIAASRVAEGQSTDCVSKLALCGEYLNSTTTPGADCCDAIKTVVTTQLDCLCKIYNQPGGLRALGIDPQQALALPKRCNLPNDVSACNALAPGASAVPPPGTPDKSYGVDRISWTGMPALVLMVSATMFLY